MGGIAYAIIMCTCACAYILVSYLHSTKSKWMSQESQASQAIEAVQQLKCNLNIDLILYTRTVGNYQLHFSLPPLSLSGALIRSTYRIVLEFLGT